MWCVTSRFVMSVTAATQGPAYYPPGCAARPLDVDRTEDRLGKRRRSALPRAGTDTRRGSTEPIGARTSPRATERSGRSTGRSSMPARRSTRVLRRWALPGLLAVAAAAVVGILYLGAAGTPAAEGVADPHPVLGQAAARVFHESA